MIFYFYENIKNYFLLTLKVPRFVAMFDYYFLGDLLNWLKMNLCDIRIVFVFWILSATVPWVLQQYTCDNDKGEKSIFLSLFIIEKQR